MKKETIGINAGVIWNLLNNNEKWTFSKLQEKSELSAKEVYAAIGWLARENKIEIEESDTGNELYYLLIEYYF